MAFRSLRHMLTALLLLLSLTTWAMATVQVRVIPMSATGEIGSTVTVTVETDSVADLGGFQFGFAYSTTDLQAVSATVNQAFDQVVAQDMGAGSGSGIIAATVFNNISQSGPSLTLATIYFKILTPVTSTITLSNVVLGKVGGTEIPSAAVGGTIVGSMPTYTVTYNGNTSNGGAVPTDSNLYLSGTAVTVLGNTGGLTRTGYAFAGWNTAADGNGTSYVAENNISIGSTNVTLYAKWTVLPINGVCGTGSGRTFTIAPATNLCYSGSATTVSGNGPWNWSCSGSNGGSTASCTADIDITGPTLTLSTLADAAITNNEILNVSGTVSDSSGIALLTINNATVNVTNGRFSYALILQAGSNTITTAATDTLGNITTDLRSIKLDTTAPVLTVSSPADNSRTAQMSATTNGTVSETSTVTVKANGGTPQGASITGNDYSATVNLTAGLNTITITATDPAGNTTSSVRTVIYDDTNPSLAITNPNQDVTTTQNSITISGTVNDLITSASVSITFNNQSYTPVITNGTFTQQLTIPSEGAFSIKVTATDEVGNSSSVTRNVIYAIPINGACGTSNGGTFSVAPASYLCSSGTASSVTGTGPWNWTCSGDNGVDASCGAYLPVKPAYLLVTYDGNGNTGGSVPTDSGSYLENATVTVQDNSGSLTKTGFSFADWNTAADGSGTNFAAASSLTIGTANVILYARWSALPTYTVSYSGNTSTGGTVPSDSNVYLSGATATVLGNTGGLSRTGYAFAGWNTAANGSGLSFAAGNNLSIASANVTLYAKWAALPTYTVSYNGNANTGGTVPTDASLYLSGAIATVLGNTGGLSRTGYAFTGWNTAANGSSTNYTEGSNLSIASANVTLYARWTVLPTNGVCGSGSGRTFTIAPATNLCNSGSATTVSGNGPWSWSCSGTNGGSTASCSADIDITGPILTLSTLADGAVTNNATLNVSGTVSDSSGVALLTINNAAVTVTNGSFSYALILQAGSNTITTVVTDTLGNMTTDLRSIKLDMTAPVLTVSSPPDNSKTAQMSATTNGTINETSTVTVKVNGGTPQGASITGNDYSATVNLSAGLNTITITATDLAGNTTSAVRTIIYDNTNPSLAITNPNQDVTTTQNSITISGMVSDLITSASVSITFNNQSYTPAISNGTFTQQLTIPSEGTFPIKVTATDEVGNSSSVTRNVIYAIPINGVCGTSNGGTFTVAPANYLCSSGTASSVTGTGPWNWTCSGDNGGDVSCIAYLLVQPANLLVTYNGNGNTGGSVPTDSVSYLANATVTVPDNTGSLTKTGYTFAGWNSDYSGSGTSYAASATFVITANVTLYAQWTVIPTYTLTVTKSGTGTGNATAGSGSITWTANSGTASYLSGTTVTITATPDSGSLLYGWTGACSNATSICSVTMDAAKSVTAIFSAIASQTIGAISFTPATVVSGGTTTASATASSGLGVAFTSVTPSVCAVSGATITAGAPGTCTIAANQSGNVAYSAAAQVTGNLTVTSPATISGAPTGVSAVAGNAQATITFTAPTLNGGSSITGYTVTSSPDSVTVTGTASPIVVVGLVNGTSYTFTVTATNGAGTSSASAASNSVIASAPQVIANGTTTTVTTNASGQNVSTIALNTSGAAVNIPAGTAMTDAAGKPMTGPLTMTATASTSVTSLPTAEAAALTADGRPLRAMGGFIDINISSASDSVKRFATPITVNIALSPSLAIPGVALEYFSFDGTRWNMEGTATVKADGTLDMKVSHLSIWAVAKFSSAPTGDINGDGKVDIADALKALQFAVGIGKPTAAELVNGDVAPLVSPVTQSNGVISATSSPNGVIDIGDAIVILQKAIGIVTW